ncbi:MAG: sugar phosphate isomerase/epimerase [Armatimonadetes bacterium]|nr:sugar phosphate isomerase/epimerase [Armatimonadota bacterium]
MAKIPVALQLYSVRHEMAEDVFGTLKAVAEMGYEGVDFAGYHDTSAEDLRDMLDDLGLRRAGTHLQLDKLVGDELQRTIEFEQTLGNRYLVVASVPPERRENRDAWLETCELLNSVAETLRPLGMYTGYHNHGWEFEQQFDGDYAWDIVAQNTVEDVIMQLDTGNAMSGGADPVELLERYPGRARTIHLKDWSADKPRQIVLGEGDSDWDGIFTLCETGGTEWYIIEQVSDRHEPLECVRQSIENIRAMGR